LARIAHGVAQALDPVALHESHGAGIEIGPNGFRTVALRRAREGFGDNIERIVPGDRRKRLTPAAFLSDAPQRCGEPQRMVLAFGVTRDFGANHTGRVRIAFSAVNSPDRPLIEPLYFERAGARAIMRTNGRGSTERQWRTPNQR